jgi:hypothetical protein
MTRPAMIKDEKSLDCLLDWASQSEWVLLRAHLVSQAINERVRRALADQPSIERSSSSIDHWHDLLAELEALNRYNCLNTSGNGALRQCRLA